MVRKRISLQERLKELRIRFLYYVFRVLPIHKRKIVFCNYVGKGFGCNPKYIALELLNRKGDWDLVWLVQDMSFCFPKGIRSVQYDSIKGIYELATAAVWIDNQRKLPYHRKRKSQLFIETWHGGGGPIKRLGADNYRNIHDKPYGKTSKHMDKIANLMVSNSTSRTKVFRSAFLYTGEILECGYPRNDILVRSWREFRPKVHQHFNLKLDEKTILYAPTYRSGRNLNQYGLDIEGVLKALKKRFGGTWTLFYRLHPTMLKKADELAYGEKVRNASGYDDVQELLAACDVLISDYSCVINDFSLTGKPVFLFATDVKEYEQDRGLYIDYRTLPFPIAENNEELIKNVLGFHENRYHEKLEHYMRQTGMADKGTASKQVVDRIEQWLEPKNERLRVHRKHGD